VETNYKNNAIADLTSPAGSVRLTARKYSCILLITHDDDEPILNGTIHPLPKFFRQFKKTVRKTFFATIEDNYADFRSSKDKLKKTNACSRNFALWANNLL